MPNFLNPYTNVMVKGLNGVQITSIYNLYTVKEIGKDTLYFVDNLNGDSFEVLTDLGISEHEDNKRPVNRLIKAIALKMWHEKFTQ